MSASSCPSVYASNMLCVSEPTIAQTAAESAPPERGRRKPDDFERRI